MKIVKRLHNKLHIRLIGFFLMVSIIPVVVIMTIMNTNLMKTGEEDVYKNLEAIAKIKSNQVHNFFSKQFDNIEFLSQEPIIINQFQELNRSFTKSGQKLDGYVYTSEYDRIVEDVDSYLKRFLELNQYSDILFIDNSGNVIYSVNRERGFATNIKNGPYKKSALAKNIRLSGKNIKPVISDFEFLPHNQSQAVLTLTNAIWDKSAEFLGNVVFIIPPDNLDKIMQANFGLGNTGAAYLKGEEGLLRSDLTSAKESKILREVAANISIPALQQNQSVHIESDEDGKTKLGNYSQLGLSELFNTGFDWTVAVEIEKDEAMLSRQGLFAKGVTIITLLLIINVILALLLSRSIAGPIEKITRSAKVIALGDMNQMITVKRKDEIGNLANSLVNLQNDLKEKVDHAIKIAKGEYSVKLKPKSEKDQLSIALNEMTDALYKSSEEKRKSMWMTGTQNNLNEKMRGDLDVEVLSQNIITYLSKHLNAQIGALYLTNGSDKELHLKSSYAFSKRKDNNGNIKVGEGLVGQAALEKNFISFTDIPDDYIHINSGLGNGKPKNIVVAPIVLEEKLIGVIELGSFKEFTDDEMELLNIVTENIAIGITSAKNRLATEELLEKTKQQSAEMAIQRAKVEKTNVELEEQARALKESESSLQAQQEELRQTNEELEEQTKALKSSENSLQEQQEELRVTNEELAERTKALEKQRDNIKVKNIELKKAQEDISKKADDLELASKYKSEFLANMSHELRTPLNSILVLSQMLSTNKAQNLSEKQVEFATTINSSGKDLLELINDVLDLSKVESGMMELVVDDVKLTQLKVDIEQKFSQVAESKNIDFKVYLHESLPEYIRTDSLRLMQVIKNFISNGMKYTEKGGVTVTISKPDSKVSMNNKGLKSKDAICISVADTGIGITSEKQGLIFEAFKQADGSISRKYGGTGLGLSISKNLAHLLGGEIQLQSQEGKGSTFSLFIPELIEQKKEEVVEKTKVRTKSVSAGGNGHAKMRETRISQTTQHNSSVTNVAPEKPPAEIPDDDVRDDRKDISKGDKIILVIEDDPNFAQILYDLAHEKDFKCLLAKNGETGLHYADFYKPQAIVLDIGLPGIDGWEVMDRLKKNADTRHIPVHFMSASDKNVEAMKMGAIGYLSKPASIESLNSAFARIETVVTKSVRNLLIVEDDDVMRNSMAELIDEDNIEITTVGTGTEGIEKLKSGNYDCLILDLGLKDISGFEMLEQISREDDISRIPVIIYTGKELSREEETKLKKYASTIIIKGAHSPERLISETSLFLHQVESKLPKDKQNMLNLVHDKEAVLSGKKVLIVDDDMRNVFALSSVLEESNIKIIVGKNGKEGIEQLKKNADTDLVLMDIMMPEMNGYEAMQEIRKLSKFKNLPIIALTAKAMKGDKDKCIEAGANDYLTKPVDADKLISLLRVWMYK